MKRKIGILTFCDNTNFGSYLQTYALYRSVKDLGFDVELIDYRKDVPDYEKVKMKDLPNMIERHGCEIGFSIMFNMIKMQISFAQLIRKTMKKSRKYTVGNIGKAKNRYETFLVGSDLVWDIRYAQSYTYMLDFASDESNKLSYAASYGYEKIPYEQKENFKKYLMRFKHISVREKMAQEELEQILDKKVEHVCDPTMLLPNAFWEEWVEDNTQENKYVLVYMPDEERKILTEAKRYARKHRVEIYLINKTDKNFCPKNPKEFITLIYYAEKVFTGSYHGLLFSIYLKKDFTFINRAPGNRLRTVSDMLDIHKYNLLDNEYDMERAVDYTDIVVRENAFRESSLNVLRGMLEDAK